MSVLYNDFGLLEIIFFFFFSFQDGYGTRYLDIEREIDVYLAFMSCIAPVNLIHGCLW